METGLFNGEYEQKKPLRAIEVTGGRRWKGLFSVFGKVKAERQNMSAYIWAIFAACIWGIVPILEKLGLSKTEPYSALLFRSFGVLIGIFLLGAFFVRPAHIKGMDAKSIFLLILSGFLASFVAQIAFYHGLKIGDVSRVVPVAGSFPLIAFILGVIVFGEAITVLKVVGMILVVTGAWLLRG